MTDCETALIFLIFVMMIYKYIMYLDISQCQDKANIIIITSSSAILRFENYKNQVKIMDVKII